LIKIKISTRNLLSAAFEEGMKNMEVKRRQTMRMAFILRVSDSKLLYPGLIYKPYIQVETCKMDY